MDVLESELGEPVEEAFASFEFEPLAAASIGQTHRAVLNDGTRVVVKVQRPGIEEIVRRDASVLRLTSRQLERRIEAARRVGVRALAEELITGIEEELDYLREAAAGMRLRENRADDDGIAIPAVHSDLSTRRILVMEEVVGAHRWATRARWTPPSTRAASAVLCSPTTCSCRSWARSSPTGSTTPTRTPGTCSSTAPACSGCSTSGRSAASTRSRWRGSRASRSASRCNDPGLLARAVRHLAGGDTTADLRALEIDLSPMLGDVTAGGGLDPKLMGEVLDVMERHGLRPPPTVTLLSRGDAHARGHAARSSTPASTSPREGTQLMTTDASAFGTPEELIQREVVRALPSLRTMPEHAEALAGQLRAGAMTVRTERYAGNDRLRRRALDRPARLIAARRRSARSRRRCSCSPGRRPRATRACRSRSGVWLRRIDCSRRSC